MLGKFAYADTQFAHVGHFITLEKNLFTFFSEF